MNSNGVERMARKNSGSAVPQGQASYPSAPQPDGNSTGEPDVHKFAISYSVPLDYANREPRSVNWGEGRRWVFAIGCFALAATIFVVVVVLVGYYLTVILGS